MKPLLAVATVALLGLTTSAFAADFAPAHRAKAHWQGAGARHEVPALLSWRARKIRAADRCWRDCQADEGRGFQACLRVYSLSGCAAANDAADRSCLRACRLSGGPLLNLAD